MAAQRVLVVDDMPEHREVVCELLQPLGCRIATASNGHEALELALAEAPDLVLLDVEMPLMDGFETCRRLKADPRTRLVPVILVTGLAARDDRVRGLQAGCDDFLTKPVDEEQLLARTRNALRTKSLIDQLEEAESVLFSLARALEAKDPYTQGHSHRVSLFAVALAGGAGMDDDARDVLRRAGLLHDVGKIGTPVAVLNKPGRLTPEEFEVIKQHSVIGHAICRPLRTLAPVVPLVRGHHERMDGSGYPDGLTAADIPTALRCLTIVDVYDALTSHRPYRRSLSHDKALEILREGVRDGWWDGGLLDLFVSILPGLEVPERLRHAVD